MLLYFNKENKLYINVFVTHRKVTISRIKHNIIDSLNFVNPINPIDLII